MGMNTITTKTTAPDIAVIIPHYNDLVRLERCLQGLMQCDLGAAEVLVVDNASPQPPDALAPQFPRVRFLTETEPGAAPTRNRGVAESTAPLLAFLDADCVPDPDWLTVARAAPARAAVTGGRVDVFDETPPPRSCVATRATTAMGHRPVSASRPASSGISTSLRPGGSGSDKVELTPGG